jgi:hypothetical protein
MVTEDAAQMKEQASLNNNGLLNVAKTLRSAMGFEQCCRASALPLTLLGEAIVCWCTFARLGYRRRLIVTQR